MYTYVLFGFVDLKHMLNKFPYFSFTLLHFLLKIYMLGNNRCSHTSPNLISELAVNQVIIGTVFCVRKEVTYNSLNGGHGHLLTKINH